jgi:hypothetical protein
MLDDNADGVQRAQLPCEMHLVAFHRRAPAHAPKKGDGDFHARRTFAYPDNAFRRSDEREHDNLLLLNTRIKKDLRVGRRQRASIHNSNL